MNYDIKDIIFLYKETTDLAISYYEIAYQIYNFIAYNKKNQEWLTLMWEYANNLNNPNKKNTPIDSIMNYVMIINILCKPKIINKLNFLREHTQMFNNEIVNLFLYCIKESNDLTNVVDIKKYICKMLTMNIMFFNFCNFLYDTIKLNISNAKLDIKNLKNKINDQFLIIKNEQINCSINDKNFLLNKNSLYKKMFNLKKQLIETKIAELEAKRIKLYLDKKHTLKHIQTIKHNVQQINKIARKTPKLILKINKLR